MILLQRLQRKSPQRNRRKEMKRAERPVFLAMPDQAWPRKKYTAGQGSTTPVMSVIKIHPNSIAINRSLSS